MSEGNNRNKVLADLLLATMPRKVAPFVIRSLVHTIFELKNGELSFDDIPDSPENLVLVVCGVIGKEMIESRGKPEKDDEEEAAAKERFRKFMESVLK